MNDRKLRTCVAAAGMAAACACATAAFASVTTVSQGALVPSGQYYTDTIGGGIGSQVMKRNDDGSTGMLDLGFTLDFFGHDYSHYWINNNGNITFAGSLFNFTPNGPQGALQPIISPFFADVDTRNTDSGLVYLRTDVANEIIVTWDAVGYYGGHADKRNSFQLVLRGPDYAIPAGEGSIGFFYKGMNWETGDASDGNGGFGGVPAAVGFGNGSGDGIVLAGSIQQGISAAVGNHFIWFDQDLEPLLPTGPAVVPEPPEWLPMLLGLLCTGGLVHHARRRRGTG